MPSIRDVAKYANVSPSTVSRVLSENGYVSTATREVVLKAIEELNYYPNDICRQLFSKRTYLIGLVIPDISHPFFSILTYHIEKELRKFGYKTMICNTISRENSEADYLNMLQCHIVDGIIMGSHSLDEKQYKKAKGPIVLFDRNISNDIPNVAADHTLGGKLAAERLIKSKCNNVLIIKGSELVGGPFQLRYASCARVLEEAGINYKMIEIPWNQFAFNDHVHFLRQTLNKFPETDGIFTTDLLALACAKILREQNVKIPEDVSIVGYDGTYISCLGEDELTTIVQPVEQIAESLVKTLLDILEGRENLTKVVTFPVYLHEGKTTR